MTIRELREKRASLVYQARDLVTAAEGKLSDEDSTRFDGLMAEADAIGETAKRQERAESLSIELEDHAPAGSPLDGEVTNPADGDEARKANADKRSAAFRNYLRGGVQSLNAEQRSALGPFGGESRDGLVTTTGADGGYTVPQDFYEKLTEAMKWYGGMLAAPCTVISSSNGQTLPIPTVNDTSNVGAILTENSALNTTGTDATFAQSSLGAYLYTSKMSKISYQLIQDSAFDLESWLVKDLGIRLARILNTHFTVGTGSGQPGGVLSGATLGVTAADASKGTPSPTTDFDYSDLVDLVHAVDKSYRGPNTRWMLHDTTAGYLRKMVDGNGRPLMLPATGAALSPGDDLNIDGYPVIVNNDMPVLAASAKPILFGDFSAYFIRNVLGTQVLRLTERFAEYLVVAFLAFERHDGILVDGGTHPIQYLQMAA